MKRVDPSTLFERWRGRALYDDELAAVARGDKAASFMWPLWKDGREIVTPDLEALDRGLSVAWTVLDRKCPSAEVIATRLPELWRIPAHAALYDALHLARHKWDHGCFALESRLFGYTDAQTQKYLADFTPYRAAAYFVVDDATAKQLRRVRGRYLDGSHTITVFRPTYHAKPRGDAKRRVAPGHLARGDMSHLLWTRTDGVVTAKRMWTATIDTDAFNAALDSRIEVLGAMGWRCD